MKSGHFFPLIQIFILSLLTLGSLPCEARSIWIEAIGVDEINPGQNYKEFYYEGTAFLDLCKNSRQNPECHLFIDKNPALAYDPELVGGLSFGGNVRPITSTELLKLFEDKLTNAIPGDTIILSMSNHGGPTWVGQSCIFLSNSDSVCESDIKKILDKNIKKPGVKLMINASGCFSGAFVDLAGPEVCVAIAADRRRFGIPKLDQGFWTSILKKNLKNSGQLRSAAVFNTSPITASESMTALICEKFRTAFPEFDAPRMELKELDNGRPCAHDWVETNGNLNLALNNILSMSEGLNKFQLCEKGLDNKNICSHIKQLESPVFANEVRALMSLSKHATEVKNELESLVPRSNLPANLYLAVLEAMKTDLASDKLFSKFSKKDKKVLLTEFNRINEKKALLQMDLDKTQKEYLNKLIPLKAALRDSLDTLTNCFFPLELVVMPKEEKHLKGYNKFPASFPREFTEKDIQEARACEDSILF